jgi:integrase
MATIKYLLQSKSNNAPIYLRLSLGRTKTLKRKTGLNIDFHKWSKATGLPKQNDSDNKAISLKLKNLESFVFVKLNEHNGKGVEVSGDWLMSIIDQHFERNDASNLELLTEYGEKFILDLKYKVTEGGKSGVSVSTEKKYRTIVNKLIDFEAYSSKRYLIKDVDLNFRSELINYFSKIDKLSDNTIGRYLKFVKSICLDAQKNGYSTSQQLEHFKGFTVKAPKVFLSFTDLDRINNTKLISENLEITRDWLTIGCYTGQRVSDLLRMTSGFIQKIQDFEFIVLEQVKTGKIVQIPVHDEVKKILDKRNGEFPPLLSENIDSNSTMFNRYLKKLCEAAELVSLEDGNCYDEETKRNVRGQFEKHKLVSSHICRRSFATNFYGNPLFPTPLLMNITAHSTEKMFLEYIGKKPIDHSLQLAKIWANEALKSKKEPQLQVIQNSSAK